EFLIPRHVDGGYGVLRSVTASSPGIALYAKRPRQQMTRAAYASLADQSANLTARNSFSPQLHLGIDLHLKSHLAPKFRQHVHVARGLVSEAKVEAFMHLASMQLLFEDALNELARRHQ